MKVDMYVLCTPQQDEEASASPSFNTMWPKTIWMHLKILFFQDFTKNYAFCLFSSISDRIAMQVASSKDCFLLHFM